MSGATIALMGSAPTAFTPVTRSYTSGSGATENVPSGATQCRIRVCGPGGNAGVDVGTPGGSGGGGGAREYTVAVANGDAFTYTVGTNSLTNSSVTGNVAGDASVSVVGDPGGTGSDGDLGGFGGFGGASSGDGTGTNGGNGGDQGAGGGNGGGSIAGWSGFGTAGKGGDSNGAAGNAGRIEFHYT